MTQISVSSRTCCPGLPMFKPLVVNLLNPNNLLAVGFPAAFLFPYLWFTVYKMIMPTINKNAENGLHFSIARTQHLRLFRTFVFRSIYSVIAGEYRSGFFSSYSCLFFCFSNFFRGTEICHHDPVKCCQHQTC